MSSSDDTERQPSTLPRLPSPCELPPGALPHHSPSHSGRARVLSLTPKMSNQSSRRNSLKSQLFSPSFDIDVNADLIQRSLSNDTANTNVEIQRILAENSEKSTSSHIKSSADRTSSNSLRMSATTDALKGTDSSVSPVQFQQALSLQEDHGSLALIAAAAAAAITATAGSSPGTVVATDDEQRQKRDTIGVAASLGQGGDRDEPYVPENNDDASREPSHTAHQWHHYAPQSLYHEQSGHFDHTGPLYMNYSYPVTEVPLTQLSIPQSTGHQLPGVPPGAAYMYAASSCNAFSPIDETKGWRRRRPKKKKKKASQKQHKRSFDRRPAKGPGSRGKRGSYRCRLCGEAKAKHDCSALEPYDASVQEDAETQTETVFADEKIALGSGIRVIAIRERRVSAAELLGGKVKSEDGNDDVATGGGRDDDGEDTPFAAV